jgi:hypothetical protein
MDSLKKQRKGPDLFFQPSITAHGDSEQASQLVMAVVRKPHDCLFTVVSSPLMIDFVVDCLVNKRRLYQVSLSTFQSIFQLWKNSGQIFKNLMEESI